MVGSTNRISYWFLPQEQAPYKGLAGSMAKDKAPRSLVCYIGKAKARIDADRELGFLVGNEVYLKTRDLLPPSLLCVSQHEAS